jgi:hypothetical protein
MLAPGNAAGAAAPAASAPDGRKRGQAAAGASQ